MILIAGVVASVLLQTMNSLQQQALKTSQETIGDVSNGLKITHISGYNNGSKISNIAIFLSITAGSDSIDLSNCFVSISDSSTQVILNYEDSCFSNSVTNGLFQTINSSNLSNSSFGLITLRDIDGTCKSDNPTINSNDLVAVMINTTACFSGIDTNIELKGYIVPEQGIRGVISFDTPSSFTDTIIELQG